MKLAALAQSNRVKRLPLPVIKNLGMQNRARHLSGLSPIVIVVRRCICCCSRFESVANRTCDDCREANARHVMSFDEVYI